LHWNQLNPPKKSFSSAVNNAWKSVLEKFRL